MKPSHRAAYFLAALSLVALPATDALAQTRSNSSRSTSGSTNAAQASDADREARGLFDAGTVAYEAGRYQDALERFRAAYARRPHPMLMYNIGQAADHLRHDEEAVEAFETYLRDTDANAPHREAVESRVAVLRASIAERNALRAAVAANGTTTNAAATDASVNAATSPDLSPEAVARSQESDVATSDSPQRVPVTKKWWFWTSIGVVVVAAVVVPIVVARAGDDHVTTLPYPASESGRPYFTRQGVR